MNDGPGRQSPDQALVDIADYVTGYQVTSAETYRAARYCLLDAIGCALEALSFPECTRLLGPVVPGAVCHNGARVPGTRFELDPVRAAFDITTMIHWLDFNDAFFGHPSDSLGGILATADYVSRLRAESGEPVMTMRDVLELLVKVYEIHGIISLSKNFPRRVFDVVPTIRVATAAVVTHMLGGGGDEIVNAVSNAWADGTCLKVYRQGSNTGSRKNWAAGDACARGVELALMAIKGEMGYPSVLTAETYGFCDVYLDGEPLEPGPYGTYVLDNVVFKFVPAGNHAQTAVECALRLHPLVKNRLDDVAAIRIRSQRPLMLVMDKQGPLRNAADRDHCAQYVIAAALIHGKLETSYFSDDFAADPRIDGLREKMTIVEDPQFTKGWLDPSKLSRANAIKVRFTDGSSLPEVEIDYAPGHPRRRAEGYPMLEEKFKRHLRRFSPERVATILETCLDQPRLEATSVDEFMGMFVS